MRRKCRRSVGDQAEPAKADEAGADEQGGSDRLALAAPSGKTPKEKPISSTTVLIRPVIDSTRLRITSDWPLYPRFGERPRGSSQAIGQRPS